MIKPTRILITVVSAVWLLAFVEIINGAETNLGLTAFCIITILAVVDILLTAKPENVFAVSRSLNQTMPVGVANSVEVVVVNNSPGRKMFTLFDHFPTVHSAEGLPREFVLCYKETGRVRYEFTPAKRGNYTFKTVEIQLKSPFRFWNKRGFCGEENQVKIYPDYSETIKYGTLSAEHRLSQMGIHKKRQRGEGTDFHQLREFRQGDRLSSIDWKATSRMNKIISRDFQQERDQQVIILLDCSKNMRSKDGELSHFDHSLNALLLLSYVAVKQGDAVGLMTFGGVSRWEQPSKSPSTVSRLLETLYDLDATGHSTDYMTTAEKCRRLIKKRAMIIVISNVREEESDELVEAVKLLKQQHLVLFAGLRENVLEDQLQTSIETVEDAITYKSTVEYLNERKRVFNVLNNQNIMTLDVVPNKLPFYLVNKYLDVKGRGVL